jgi:hypothetical protein
LANLNSRSFLNRWQMIRHATMPSPESVHWRVADVEWRRERHAFAGGNCSFAIEVHTLASAAHRRGWSLMVVVEHWWTGDKQALRTLTWARRLTGNSTTIFGWVRDHETVRRATGS